MAYYNEKDLQNIKAGLVWAKKNPEAPESKKILEKLKSGQMNFELKALGLNPVPVKKPQVDLSKALGGQVAGQQTMMPEQGRLSDIGADLKEGFNELQQVAPERGEKSAERMKMMASPRTFGQGGFGVVAQGLGAFLDVAGIAAKTAAKALMTPDQEAQWQRGLENTINKFPQIKDAGEAVMTAYEELKTTNPDLARSIEDAGILAEFAVGTSKPVREGVESTIEAGGEAAREAARLTKQGAEATQEALETGVRKVGETVDTALEARRPAQIAKQQEKVNTAVSRIIQAGDDPRAIEQAKRALGEIDTSDVNSFNDLNVAFDDKVKALSRAVDTELEKYPEKYDSGKLGIYTKVGDKNVVESPVQDALDGLETAYSKSGEAVKAETVRQLKQKLQEEGLTLKEINQIAREYGIEYKDRAFDKMGNAKSGYNAENYEIVRKGVKQVVRERLPNEITKELDSKISDIYSTKDLTKKMSDKVAKLEQKITNRTLAQKVGGGVASAVDLVTMGGLRGFIAKLLPSNMGNKAMNSLEIQNELRKNLNEVEKLLEMKDDKKFADAFAKWAEEMQPGMSVRSSVTPRKVGSQMTEEEFDVVVNNIDDVILGKTADPDFNAFLDKYGLSKAEPEELKRFLREATDEFERPGSTDKFGSFNQSAKTKTTDLVEEAKKYDSADEFITNKIKQGQPVIENGNIVVWHNTSKSQNKGTFSSETPSINTLGGDTTERIVLSPQKTKIALNQESLYKELTGEEIPEGTFDFDVYDRKIYDLLKSKGYDTIQYSEPYVGRSKEWVILDNEAIREKKPVGKRSDAINLYSDEITSQLEDIWKQANQKGSTDLLEEARSVEPIVEEINTLRPNQKPTE